jgi:hypothetical protein
MVRQIQNADRGAKLFSCFLIHEPKKRVSPFQQKPFLNICYMFLLKDLVHFQLCEEELHHVRQKSDLVIVFI